MKPLLTLSTFTLLAFCHCGRSESEVTTTPTPGGTEDAQVFKNGPLSGLIAGESWQINHAIVQEQGERFRLVFAPQNMALSCSTTYRFVGSVDHLVMVDLPILTKSSYSYPTSKNEYIQIYPNYPNGAKRLATSGKVMVDRNEEQKLYGKMVFKYDEQNTLNGSFVGEICPRKLRQ